MRITSYRFRVLVLSASLLLLSASFPIAGVAGDEAANANAETAGERAHFAQSYCAVSPERIGMFKERIRKVLHGATDFDQHWQTGWHRGEREDSQMESLRLSDPQEFSSRVKSSCERLKWVVKNSMRARSQK